MMTNVDNLIVEYNKIQQQSKDLRKKLSDIESKIAFELSNHINDQLSKKEYGCGTANIKTSCFNVKAVVSKKVKWDQEKLEFIEKRIKESGQDPKQYLNIKYDVSETAFSAWPDHIKNEFLGAREVEPSKPKLTFTDISED